MDAVDRAIASGDDLYEQLGVDPGASDEAIRHAYRALARRYHPDVHPADDRSGGFRRIVAAYQILGDERRRAAYDRARRLERLAAQRDARPGPVAAHAAPRPTGVTGTRGRVVSPNPADHGPRAEDVAPVRPRPPVDEWRLVSMLGRVVAAAAALVVIAVVALVIVSASAGEPEPVPPTMWCRTPDGWYDCWEATSPDGP